MVASVTALALVTAPAETPVTLAEAKAQLRVTSADDDSYITALIAAAVAYVDAQGLLGRAMITQTWAQWMPQGAGFVRLIMGPFVSLTSVEYYDDDGALQTATLSDYETRLSGDFVTVGPKDGYAWPTAQSRLDAIKITYVAGFGAAADVPDGIKHALKMLVAHWYEHREAVSDIKMGDIPMAVDALIGTERVGWYG